MIQKRYPYEPDSATPPGRTLEETIAALGMDQRELAIRTGLDKKTINQIIKGEHPLSHPTAIKLERATGVPARIWNNLETQFRELLARLKDRERLSLEVEWLKEIPTRELTRRGVVEAHRDKVALLRGVLTFFGVSSTEEWRQLWNSNLACRFRRSSAFTMQPGATAAWLRLGELRAQKLDCRPYDRERFIEALREIRGLTTASPAEWQPGMIDRCAQSGVAVVFVKEIKGCPACGVTRWLAADKALLQLCLRYKADDHFWFTFFHEAAHIVHDPKKAIFIEDGQDEDEFEKRANRFAADFLIPSEHVPRMSSLRSREDVVRFAQQIGIAPGIVVGQMQKRGLLPCSHLNGLKRKLEWAE